MTSSLENTRLAVGGLLIAASLAIGAGSGEWTPGSFARATEAPALAVMDAVPPAVVRAREPIKAAAALEPVAPAIPVEAPEIEDVPEPLLVMEGGASWYSDALAGRRTASGEPYDPGALIAAHRALPFGTLLRVTNLANGRSVEVRVIDRGPFIAGRIVDLSRVAAEEIGILRAGHGRVRVEVLEYGDG